MSGTGKWIVAIVAAALVVGLLAYARGHEHFRGDDEGALGLAAYAQRALSD